MAAAPVTARALAAALAALPADAADALVVADAVHRWSSSAVTGVQVLDRRGADELGYPAKGQARVVVLECDL